MVKGLLRVIAPLVVLVLALPALAAGSRAALPKVVVVDTTVDAADTSPADGVCSAKVFASGGKHCTLRAAVQTVNAGKRGAYLISVPEGTFRLTAVGMFEDKAAKGDLDITQADVAIVGKGAGKTIVDGNALDRVFDVSAFAQLRLVGLRVHGGKLVDSGSGGGGINVRGGLVLDNVYVDRNVASQVGGGLRVDSTGSVEIKSSTLAYNQASIGGAAAIYGSASFVNTSILSNTADNSGNVAVWGKASLAHATVAYNKALSPSQVTAVGVFKGGKATIASSIVLGSCFLYWGDHFPYPQHNVVTSPSCADDPPVSKPGLSFITKSATGLPVVALKSTSPAVDVVPVAGCPSVDERGLARPQGAACDAGAYELPK
ncbi:MAG: choice-of-anchor Q domain-containing protein [Gaiellales bacterium]